MWTEREKSINRRGCCTSGSPGGAHSCGSSIAVFAGRSSRCSGAQRSLRLRTAAGIPAAAGAIPIEVGRTKRYTVHERIQKFLQQTALPPAGVLQSSGSVGPRLRADFLASSDTPLDVGGRPTNRPRDALGGGTGGNLSAPAGGGGAAATAAVAAADAAGKGIGMAKRRRRLRAVPAWARSTPPGPASTTPPPPSPPPVACPAAFLAAGAAGGGIATAAVAGGAAGADDAASTGSRRLLERLERPLR